MCIFCGTKQFSTIIDFFGKVGCGTVRGIVWEKTNPSPMNGEFVYLSGVEFAVWFKKSRATFNGFCKNTVFRYPSIESNIHPTQKPVGLFQELITDNTKEGDIVFDPCMGSGTTAVACVRSDRNYIGFELIKNYYDLCTKRVEAEKALKERDRFFYNLVNTDDCN